MRWTVVTERQIGFDRLESLQQDLVQRVRAEPNRAYLLISEPTPTFTKGRFASNEECLWTEERRLHEGVAIHPVSRGGKWTYHGPGQILFYPLVNLQSLGYSRRAVYRFVTELREAIAAPLLKRGLDVTLGARPFGLYFRGKKLASFGVAVERGIVSHGVALYWNNQSRFFEGIHPCGVPGQSVTSLEESGWSLSWDDTAREVAESIEKSLNH